MDGKWGQLALLSFVVFFILAALLLIRKNLRKTAVLPLVLWSVYTALLLMLTLLGRGHVAHPMAYFMEGWDLFEPDTEIDLDTTYNLLMFIPWSLLGCLSFARHKKPLAVGLQLSLTGMLFSAFIEGMQLVTYRGACQLSDVVYNTISAILGVLLFLSVSMRQQRNNVLMLFCLFFLCGCGKQKSGMVELFPVEGREAVSLVEARTDEPEPTPAEERGEVVLATPTPSEPVNHFFWAPERLETIPKYYFDSMANGGRLVSFFYMTSDIMEYDENKRTLEKRAFIYLPPGYDETKKYDIMYMMHGGGGNESWLLGAPGQLQGFKNVVDHAITDKRIKPLIIVCPTYNNAAYGSKFTGGQAMAMKLCGVFYKELMNDLVPAVERHYSTYAEGKTDPESLRASREHRCFGGFSNGSVATWYVFAHGTDYFAYFMPMSCGAQLPEIDLDAIAMNLDPDSFFIYVMTGTRDFAYSHDSGRAQDMADSPYYKKYSATERGNFVFRAAEGYTHSDVAAREYIYNGMQFFFGYG